MLRTPLNTGWYASRATGLFESPGASERRAVHLPHDMLRHVPRTPDGTTSHTGYHPGAAVQYSRGLDLPADAADRRHVLELEGVYRDAMVYVNGALAGRRPEGYTRFHVPLDPYLHPGATNELLVVSRVHEDSRWYTGAGIHREVHLLTGPLVHVDVDGLTVTTPDVEEDQAVVAVATTVRNESTTTRTVQVRTELVDPDGALVCSGQAPVTVMPGRREVVRQRLVVRHPRRWDLQTPHLYVARTTLTDDDVPLDEESATFGIRTLQLDPVKGFRLNGRSIELRGACIHHDNGVLGAAAIRRAEERRVERLKEAGFTALRSAHNPMSPAMLNACDRVGMLVMDEAFDVWTVPKTMHDYALRFEDWWAEDVAAMVAKDRNHPSVIMYSIGNEIPETGTGTGAGIGRRIAEHLRALDPTRFVTNGINPLVSVLAEMRDELAAGDGPPAVNEMGEAFARLGASRLATERTAEAFATLDVAGMNYTHSRYVQDAEDFPHRVIVGTETAPAQIAENWALVRRLPHVIGDFTWTGWDYLGETGIGRTTYGDTPQPLAAPYPWLTAWCGDIDITGHRRPASYYREIVFGLRTEPYVAVRRPERHGQTATPTLWSWSDSVASWSWDVEPGSPVTVEVYAAAPEVELLVNGLSQGRRPAGPDHGYLATFETTWQPGELVAVARDGDREVGRHLLRTAGPDLRLVVRADRDRLVADDGDLAHLEITVEDADGVVAHHRAATVEVSVSGAGVLEGLGSAHPATTEPFDGDRATTFDGRALAVVRPVGPGAVQVTVRADGYETVETHLDVLPA